jgi:hypothetical protein
MRMEKNGVMLSFHGSHISIFDTSSRRHAFESTPLKTESGLHDTLQPAMKLLGLTMTDERWRGRRAVRDGC